MGAELKFISAIDIESIAVDALKRFGLYGVPVNPVQVAEAEGISVFRVDFGDDAISGVIRKELEGFAIYFNAAHPLSRARYTIAHELGHYYLHREFVTSFVDPEMNLYRSGNDDNASPERRMEIQANRFAASLLMPTQLVKESYAETCDLAYLANKFDVSREAMGIRINSLRLE